MSPDTRPDAAEPELDHGGDTASEAGGESHLTLSWILGHPLIGAASVSSAGAGLVHAAAAGTHSSERVAAVLFAVTGALQVAWSFYYLARPTRTPAVLGMVLNGAFAAMWLASRTIGLPFPEALSGVEHVSVQDTIAALLGLVAAICAGFAARRPERVRDHRARSVVAAAVVSVAVVVLAVGGVSATHGHGSGESDHSAMDMSSSGEGSSDAMAGMDMGAMQETDATSDMPGMSGDAGVAPGGSTPSAGVDFARSTVIRRAQELRMAELAGTNSTDSDVIALAAFLAASNPPEVDLMAERLDAAGHDVPDRSSVSTEAVSAPFAAALLSESDFAKLENAYGPTFDRVFVSLLERHHDGAITSAGLVLGSGADPTTRETARDVLLRSATQLATVSRMADAVHSGEPTPGQPGADDHGDDHP